MTHLEQFTATLQAMGIEPEVTQEEGRNYIILKTGIGTLPPDVQAQCDEITQETVDLMRRHMEKMACPPREPRRPHNKGNPVPYSQRQLNRIRR